MKALPTLDPSSLGRVTGGCGGGKRQPPPPPPPQQQFAGQGGGGEDSITTSVTINGVTQQSTNAGAV